jgi:hypothetical protein
MLTFQPYLTQNKVNIIMDVLAGKHIITLTKYFVVINTTPLDSGSGCLQKLDPDPVVKNHPDPQHWFRGLTLSADIKNWFYKKYIDILIIDTTNS